MAHNEIETAAFIPDPGAGLFTEFYQALAFPADWREPIRRLLYGEQGTSGDHRPIPIMGINSAIRALAPDLVSVAEWATRNDDKPWLYTKHELSTAVLKTLVATWLHTRKPSPDDFERLTRTIGELDLDSVDWVLTAVTMGEQQLSRGGTAVPARHLYRLLPDVLAARIAALPPYEYCGTQVTFCQAATDQGAELVSWPPSVHVPVHKGKALEPWHYSGVIKISLRTVPFEPVPRIHLSVGVRRWVRGEVWPADGDATTVYMRTNGPWLAGAEQSARFAAVPLKVWHAKDSVSARWAHGSSAAILRWLEISRDFPDAPKLAADAEGWLDHQDGITAAVTYHTAMGYHGVESGLMPSERMRLIRWATNALLPEFRPDGRLTTDRRVIKGVPEAVLQQYVSIPKEPKEKEDDMPERAAKIAHARNENQARDASNAILRRELLAEALGGEHVLVCHLLFQTAEVEKAIIDTAVKSLGLTDHLLSSPATEIRPGAPVEGTWTWRTPELEVRIHARDLGEHGGDLGRGTPPKRGKATQEAIEIRRREVSEFLTGLPQASQGVIAEIDGKKAYRKRRRTADPKFAIRLGCADAGRVSQFITVELQSAGAEAAETPDDATELEDAAEKSSLEHRAEAAWADLLRQVGMNFIPRHTLGNIAIPAGLNQVAFWIARRNSDGPTWNPQFTPVAILVRPGQATVLGRTPDTEGWVPYPKLLRELTGQVRGEDIKYEDQQKAKAAQFIRETLGTLSGEPTVVMAYAQNTRYRWDWLQDGHIEKDKIQFGDGPVQRIALHRGLRIIRVRDGVREESPEWWVPKNDEHAGLSKALWAPPGAWHGDEQEGSRFRVFGSTTEKGKSHSKIGVDDTKLTRHNTTRTVKGEDGAQKKVQVAVTNAGKNAWNPTLLEITVAALQKGDDPRQWAMYTHQQRFPDTYDEGLKLPLILHLAELATEYALPHEYKLLEEANNDDTGGASGPDSDAV